MALQVVPARGRWEQRVFDLLSTATFVQGSLVKLHAARRVSEYSGGESAFLGIAASHSSNSLPAGKIVVYIPASYGCTALADVPTGVAASSLSLGETVGFYKSGNTVSTITTSYTSTAGRIAVIVGAINSVTSQIEVEFLGNALTLNSTTSATIP